MRISPPAWLLAPMLGLALVAGCATRPPHEFDEAADFTALRTFQWLEPEYGDEGVAVSDPVLESPLLGRRVERAAVAALQAKGFELVTENPDFLVTFHTAEGERERRPASYLSIGYGRYSPRWGSSVILDMTPRTFPEGTLIIDVVDAQSGELVWRGWRDAYLTQRNFQQDRINDAVNYIFTAFPPGS